MKMRHSLVLLTAAVCLALTFNACKKGKSDDNKPTEQAGKIPGMGGNTGTPEGEQYVLPAGITLSGAIYGYYCDSTYIVGSGYHVTVCIGLRSDKTKDTTIILPAGLVILADNAEEDQHGMLVQEAKVLLKAKKITRVSLASYCINSDKHGSSSDQTYTLGPVASSPLMRELIGLLSNKKVNKNEYTDEDEFLEVTSIVQGMVWSITDGTGFTKELRDMMLAEIPDK